MEQLQTLLPARLLRSPSAPKLVGTWTGIDLTQRALLSATATVWNSELLTGIESAC